MFRQRRIIGAALPPQVASETRGTARSGTLQLDYYWVAYGPKGLLRELSRPEKTVLLA